MLFSLIVLSPTQAVVVFHVYFILKVFNNFSIKPTWEMIYLFLSFSTFIPRMKFIGSTFEILNLFLIMFIVLIISESSLVITISSTYSPIKQTSFPFLILLNMHFSEISWLKPLFIKNLVIVKFHCRPVSNWGLD